MRALTITRAFMRRDWVETRSYRLAFVLGIVDAVLRLAIFFFIAKIVDPGGLTDDDLEAGYFAFAVVGLALSEILSTGLTSIAAKLRQEQYTGTLEVMLAAPIGTGVLVCGLAAFEFVRALMSGALLLVAAIVIFGVDFTAGATDYLALIPALIGSIGVFVAVGVALAAATIVYKRTNSLTTFVTEVLAVLGGVYFPLSVLPGPLEALGAVLPFTWAVDLARGILITGEVRVAQLLALIGFAVVTIPAAIWLFVLATRRARRAGSLVEY